MGSKDSTLTVGNLVTSKRHVLLQTARAVATNRDFKIEQRGRQKHTGNCLRVTAHAQTQP